MPPKIGIIGHGRIGSELSKRVKEKKFEVIIADLSGIYTLERKKLDTLSNWLKYFRKVDIACLCIPTLDDGRTAFHYMKALLRENVPVVTAEKGALANYFPELKLWLDKIGYSATVGGGTRMLGWLKDRISTHIEEIHLVINGTLNYIFHQLSEGRSLHQVIEMAKELGYAEPKAKTPLEVINAEANGDIPRKTAILINVCNLGEIREKEISVVPFSEKDLEILMREAKNRRYIVSISQKELKEEVIGGFKFKINKWYITAGFKRLNSHPLFSYLRLPKVDNGVVISGLEGRYFLCGPGAGAIPTVCAGVIKDIEKLIKDKLV